MNAAPSPSSAAPSAAVPFRPGPVLFALWLTVFAASSQVIIVSPLLPDIARTLQVPEAHLGWLVTAYAAALGAFALLAGPVSDRVGRRRILLWGAGAMAVVLGLHGLARTFPLLLAARALAGAAGGLLSGAAVAYVGDAFPYERRGWANGWVMSGIAAGQVLGVPAGKWLALHLGYVWPFLAFGVLAALAWALLLLRVPQPDVDRATAPLTPAEVARGYAGLLRESAPRAAVLAYLLMFSGVGFFVTYFAVWLEREVGLTGTEIIALFLAGGLTNVVAGPLAGRLSDRFGRRPLIFVSCLLFAGVMLAAPYAIRGVASAAGLFALAMLSVALRLSPLQSLLSALVPAERRGVMMSAAVATGQLGMAAAAGLAGPLYANAGFAGNTVAGAAALLGMAAVVARALPEPASPALAPGVAAGPAPAA